MVIVLDGGQMGLERTQGMVVLIIDCCISNEGVVLVYPMRRPFNTFDRACSRISYLTSIR